MLRPGRLNVMGVIVAACVALASGCTVYHSRQAISATIPDAPPADDATFVTEEDAGFALFGLIVFSEPAHYAVLLERARRRHGCARLSHVELDFRTDHFLLVGFPVARIRGLCARREDEAGSASESETGTETVTESASESEPEPGSEPAAAPAPTTEGSEGVEVHIDSGRAIRTGL